MKKILLILTIMVVFIAGCSAPETSQTDPMDTADNPDSSTPDEDNEQSQDDLETAVEDALDEEGFKWDTSQAVMTDEDCYDSDGGSFDKIKGFVIDANKERFEDECVNSFSVNEYYCGITGYKSDKIINCKYRCEDGICIEGETDKECVDSDYYDEFNKGTVTYKGNTMTDYCDTDKVLIEQVCSNVDIATTKDVVCESGCSDGRCNPVTEVDQKKDCTDPDQGPDQAFTRTTVVDKKGSFTDECLNPYEVKEYYCNSYGFHADKNIRCDNGCEEGVCVE